MQKGTTLALDSAGYTFAGAFATASGSGDKVKIKIGNGGTLSAGSYTILTASKVTASASDFQLVNAVASNCSSTFAVSGNKVTLSIATRTKTGAGAARSKAGWLARLDEAVAAKLAALPDGEVDKAYLLNLNPGASEFGGVLAVTGYRDLGETVEVDVELVRTGAMESDGGEEPINGVLRLLGAATPDGEFTDCGDAVEITDATFAESGKATCVFTKDGVKRFFKPVITAD